MPLSEEQKRNYQEDIDRFEEEKFAAKSSFPTKLLGWMLIAGVGLQIAGTISDQSYNFGGILFLIVGFRILKGSQGALRLATFFAFPGAVFGLLRLIWTAARNEPLEINRAWKDYHDLAFWTLEVSPCMYFAAESIVATYAFRLRKIPFWTKTVRLWAAVAALVLLIKFLFFTMELVRQSETRRSLPKELAAAKAHFSAYGSSISGSSMRASEQTFSELPNILQIGWKNSPNSTTEIYRKKSQDSPPAIFHRDHSEWLKLPSGEWGRIDMELILPEKP
ncbi:MAG TPA: hypothetical protein VGE67_06310 [Haloferula sp.]